ncbi:hypothetical protein EJB05_39132, partial [Eragrostis curvula]
MAQPPGSPTADLPAPGKPRLCLAMIPAGCVFRPKPRELIDCYLIPQALHGRVPDNLIQDGVAHGVDVHAARPEALPFPSCNRDRDGDHPVWGYFFTTRPEDAAGSGKYVREVAAGGRWCWCGGHDKGYAGYGAGEVYAFRTRFAYYEDDGKMTQWRMKEYRLNEGAACFRGVAFRPGAANLVVWKVYYELRIDEVKRPMEYNSSDEKSRTKRIKTG